MHSYENVTFTGKGLQNVGLYLRILAFGKGRLDMPSLLCLVFFSLFVKITWTQEENLQIKDIVWYGMVLNMWFTRIINYKRNTKTARYIRWLELSHGKSSTLSFCALLFQFEENLIFAFLALNVFAFHQGHRKIYIRLFKRANLGSNFVCAMTHISFVIPVTDESFKW